MDSIELRLDEANELVFDVEIKGTDTPSSAPKFRFVCEGNDIEYSFKGSVKNGKVVVDVPPMKGMLDEGTYQSRLEIIIDDRYFAPLKLESAFKTSLKVTVEGVTVNKGGFENVSKKMVTETPKPRVRSVTAHPGKGTLAEKFKTRR